MQYELLKYRGVPIDPDMPSAVLFKLHSMLVGEGQRNDLDPYLYKVIIKPPTKKVNTLG